MNEEVSEKKVEYIELIYDLIFVYSFRRNSALMKVTEGGFVHQNEFLAFILLTLAVVQIWNFTTYYINMYGQNSQRNHVCLFINMFLLYFMGVGEKAQWQEFQIQHHIAWGLILLNLSIQYALELRRFKDDPEQRRDIMKVLLILAVEALLIFVTTPMNGIPAMAVSLGVILLGTAAMSMVGRGSFRTVDFMHLSERAMLLVVLTFGEMIIALTDYFHDGISLNNIYFALMAFLIVIGLFLSYGLHYDRMIDREQKTNGLSYLALHMLIIPALNFITCSLEYMREEEIRLMPKMLFLIFSLLAYYVCLLLLDRFAKPSHRHSRRFFLSAAAVSAVFALLMLLLRNSMRLNIAVTVLFVFCIYLILYRSVRVSR